MPIFVIVISSLARREEPRITPMGLASPTGIANTFRERRNPESNTALDFAYDVAWYTTEVTCQVALIEKFRTTSHPSYPFFSMTSQVASRAPWMKHQVDESSFESTHHRATEKAKGRMAVSQRGKRFRVREIG